MLRAFAFLCVTVSWLWWLDIQVLFLRLFAWKRVEPFLNRRIQHWSRQVVAQMGLFLGFKAVDDTQKSVRERLPENFILLANHQSLIDILIVFCFFPGHQMRFVAKKSLGKWFPGVSATLRYQKHGLITRNSNPKETVAVVTGLARRSYEKKHCPVIFPEGSRSRTGELGTFQAAGLRMMLDRAPLPLVVMAIDGGSKLSTLRAMLSPSAKRMYLRILDVQSPPKGKTETTQALDRAKELIGAQLALWRGAAPGQRG